MRSSIRRRVGSNLFGNKTCEAKKTLEEEEGNEIKILNEGETGN